MSNKSPTLAALLSFVFPGLGQIYAGQIRKGVIWAIPMLLIVVGAGWLVFGGRTADRVRHELEQPGRAADLQRRLLPVPRGRDDRRVRRRSQREPASATAKPRGAPIALAALIAIAIMIHGFPEVYGYRRPQHVLRDRRLDERRRHGRASLPASTPNPSYVAPTDHPRRAPAQARARRRPDRSGADGLAGPRTPSDAAVRRSTCIGPGRMGTSRRRPAQPAADRRRLTLGHGSRRQEPAHRLDDPAVGRHRRAARPRFSASRATCARPQTARAATARAIRTGSGCKLPDEDTQSAAGQAGVPERQLHRIVEPVPGHELGRSADVAVAHRRVLRLASSLARTASAATTASSSSTCDRAWRALVGTHPELHRPGDRRRRRGQPERLRRPRQQPARAVPDGGAARGDAEHAQLLRRTVAVHRCRSRTTRTSTRSSSRSRSTSTQGCHYVDAEYSLAYARSRHAGLRLPARAPPAVRAPAGPPPARSAGDAAEHPEPARDRRRPTCTRASATRTSSTWRRSRRASMRIVCTRRTSRRPT